MRTKKPFRFIMLVTALAMPFGLPAPVLAGPTPTSPPPTPTLVSPTPTMPTATPSPTPQPGEWTDPIGDVTLPNADIISGSGIVSAGMVDLRVQFSAPPFPSSPTYTLGWCIDTDQNTGTGSACGFGSGVGADIGFGVEGSLSSCNLSVGLAGFDVSSHLWYDPATITLRLFFPLSLLFDDGVFNYSTGVAFGGSGGANETAPDDRDFGSPGGFFTSKVGDLLPFDGVLSCPATPTPIPTPTPPTPIPTPTPPTPIPTPTPATPQPPTSDCIAEWGVSTINTLGKGQSPTNNAKVSHSITGNIIDPGSLSDTAHRIEVCLGTVVTSTVTDTTGTPANTGGGTLACDATGCSGFVEATEKYQSVSQDGKDKDRITFIPKGDPVVGGECPCWTEPELDEVAVPLLFRCEVQDDRALISGELEFARADLDGPSCELRAFTPLVYRFLIIPLVDFLVCRNSIAAECISRGF